MERSEFEQLKAEFIRELTELTNEIRVEIIKDRIRIERLERLTDFDALVQALELQPDHVGYEVKMTLRRVTHLLQSLLMKKEP